MNDREYLERPLSMAEALRSAASPASALEPVARLIFRLGQAIDAGSRGGMEQPVTIALVGSTGSGKSAIFNSLVGLPEASPTATTRGQTKVPYVACSRLDFPLLPELEKVGARQVDAAIEGVVVVDTPDLDSVERENRAIARKVIESSDVIVYVTIPDRISDFAIHDEVRSWARRKRWFFVLNKVDLYEASADEVRDGLDERLRELDFEPDDRVRFLISAKEPDRFEFAAFKRAIASSRAEEKVRALRAEAVLRLLGQALDEESIRRPLQKQVDDLREHEARLMATLTGLYRSALETDASREAIRLLIRGQTWQNLALRTGWIMGAVIRVRCRLALVSSAWQLGRMVTRGPNLFGFLWIGIMSVVSAVRGMLPLRNLRTALSGGFEREVKAVERDALRVLEDAGLPSGAEDLPGQAPDIPEVRGAWLRTLRGIPAVGEEAARALEATWRHRTVADDLVDPLLGAVETAADEAARRSAGFFLKFMANLLPTAVLLHVSWRVGEAWYLAQWLPIGFYGLALTIFFLSLIPGYLLLSVSVRGRSRAPTVETVLEAIDRPAPIRPLRLARERLETLFTEVEGLHRTVAVFRETLETELPIESFGAAAGAGDGGVVDERRIPASRT